MRQLTRIAFDHASPTSTWPTTTGRNPVPPSATWGQLLRTDFARIATSVIISTKAGYEMWPGPYGDLGSRKYLIASLDQSLKRLGLDYVDIFYHHRMDPETPLEETMGALAQIVASGKALYVGTVDYDGPTLEKAAAILDELQVPFHHQPEPLQHLRPHRGAQRAQGDLAAPGPGLITFSPLDQGLLTDRYLDGVIPSDSRIATDGRFLHAGALTEDKLKQIHDLNNIAAMRGQTLAEMALAWLLHDDAVTSVLVGASKPEQLLDNLKALENTEFTTANSASSSSSRWPDSRSDTRTAPCRHGYPPGCKGPLPILRTVTCRPVAARHQLRISS